MTNEIINCEYCIVLGNENKCKALQIETHTCLGITAKNKCPIYKLKQQLKRKEQELEQYKKSKQASYETMQIEWNEAKNEVKQLKKSVRSNKDKRKKAIEKYLKLKEFTNKEFQELKAENEELKDKLLKWLGKEGLRQSEKEFYEEQLDQLKAELEKYKQLANSFEADFYNALSDKESNYVKKLKQALQQIREVVELAMEEVLTIGQRNATAKILEILQKCEVIKE